MTAVATSAVGLTTSAWQAGALRAVAWSARGARSPARDALLSSIAPREAYGRAFGLERAGDNLGAVVGPLLAALLVGVIGIRTTMLLAIVPGAFAAVAITFAASEARAAGAPGRRRARLELRALFGAGIGRPLVPIVFFELGNCATTLLILRATHLLQHGGRSLTAATSVAVLIYAAHNLFGAGIAYAGGHWIDRTGPRAAFATGALLFMLAYLGFALTSHSWPLLLLLFCLAGSGIGLAETAESTVFAQAVPAHIRGSGFGLLGAIQSFGALASSAGVGLIWVRGVADRRVRLRSRLDDALAARLGLGACDDGAAGSVAEACEPEAAEPALRRDRVERRHHLARHEPASVVSSSRSGTSCWICRAGRRPWSARHLPPELEEPVAVRRWSPENPQMPRGPRRPLAPSSRAGGRARRRAGAPCRACSPAYTMSFCQMPSPARRCSGQVARRRAAGRPACRRGPARASRAGRRRRAPRPASARNHDSPGPTRTTINGTVGVSREEPRALPLGGASCRRDPAARSPREPVTAQQVDDREVRGPRRRTRSSRPR